MNRLPLCAVAAAVSIGGNTLLHTDRNGWIRQSSNGE